MKANKKIDVVDNNDICDGNHELTEEQMGLLVDTAEKIMDAAGAASDGVGGDLPEFIEVLCMSLGLAAGRTGFSRGGMLEMLLEWYDQGALEGEEMDQDIEVELESDTIKAN